MACGTGGHKHVVGRQRARVGVQFKEMLLRSEHDAVFRLVVDFDLRVIGPHVALRASRGQPSQCNGTGVSRVASRAGADGAVVVWLADCMALLATRLHCRATFCNDEGVWRPLGAARLKLLAERDLFRSQALLAVDRGPAWRRMTAVQEFLIDAFVTTAAISCREMGADDKAVVILSLLAFGRLMAVETVHALFGVRAHLVFVDDGVLQARVALCTLSAGTDEVCCWLLGLNARPRTIDEKGAQDQCKRDGDRNEDRTKRHGAPELSGWVE